MFFAAPPVAPGRIPPSSPTEQGVLEYGSYCILQFNVPADNAGPGLMAVVERSADGVSGWIEVQSSLLPGTGNQGASVAEAADPANPTYYRVWLARLGVRSAAAASYTRLAAPVIITVTVDPPASGTTTGQGGYVKDSTATVEAFPASGFAFESWREGSTAVSFSNPYSFPATADRDLVARFNDIPPGPWMIAVSASNPTWGSVSGGGSYADSDTVTVEATPASGYRFLRWTESGSEVSTSASYSFTATAGRTLIAVFEFIPTMWTISATPSDGGLGSVGGAGVYNNGEAVSLTAFPEPGKWFIRWTEGGIEVSTSNPYNFTASANRHLVAELGTDV